MADDRKPNLPVPRPDNGTQLLLYQSEDGQAHKPKRNFMAMLNDL